MELTYFDFLNRIVTWFMTTTVSGSTVGQWSQICLESEIELNANTIYPGLFVTPQPFYVKNETLTTFVARVYLVTQIDTDRSDRFTKLSRMYDWAMAAFQQIPDEFNGLQWPMPVTPIVLFDLQGDALYIDITLVNNNPCY